MSNPPEWSNRGGSTRHVVLGVGFRTQDALAIDEIRRRIARDNAAAWAAHAHLIGDLLRLVDAKPDGSRPFGGYPEELRNIIREHSPWSYDGGAA